MLANEDYYLKPNVIVEPLVNHWYAWSFLISPATCAMLIANSHLKVMNSYIQAPELHVQALQHTELQGGPFIQTNSNKTDYIKRLLQEISLQYQHMLEFAEAIKELANLLQSETDGHSLESLYPKIPKVLKGYVELLYDTNNVPSFRLIESLLYESEYFIEKSQTVLLSVNYDETARLFSLSTPRIPAFDQAQIKQPFRNYIYDDLFTMRNKPIKGCDLEHLMQKLFPDYKNEEDIIYSFFTNETPQKKPVIGKVEDTLVIKYFGHACLLIESLHCSILIDPVISYESQANNPRYTYADLPETIDYLVITHAHQDHILLEHLLQLRHKVKTVIVPKNSGGFLIDPSLKLFFKYIGYKHVLEIDDMEEINIPGGSITGIPFLGEHADLNIQTKKAHLIRQNSKSILCAADSNNISPEMYIHVHKIIGDIDILFVGMECDGAPLTWVYGSLLTKKITRSMDQSRRLNGSDAEKAMQLIKQFNCKQVYVYAMGMEPWFSYILKIQYHENSKPLVESKKLVEQCRQLGLISERLFGIKEIIF